MSIARIEIIEKIRRGFIDSWILIFKSKSYVAFEGILLLGVCCISGCSNPPIWYRVSDFIALDANPLFSIQNVGEIAISLERSAGRSLFDEFNDYLSNHGVVKRFVVDTKVVQMQILSASGRGSGNQFSLSIGFDYKGLDPIVLRTSGLQVCSNEDQQSQTGGVLRVCDMTVVAPIRVVSSLNVSKPSEEFEEREIFDGEAYRLVRGLNQQEVCVYGGEKVVFDMTFCGSVKDKLRGTLAVNSLDGRTIARYSFFLDKAV